MMKKIQKQCAICEQHFTPKTVDSVYCSKKCGEMAYRRKKTQKKKEEQQKVIVEEISDDRLYISSGSGCTFWSCLRLLRMNLFELLANFW